jgi:Spy/CpxP family protein refolding chaperone
MEWDAEEVDMMKRWVIAGAVITGTVLTAGWFVWAAERGDWGHGGWGQEPFGMSERMLGLLDNQRFKTEIGLNDQQVDRLRQILVEVQKSSIKTRADLRLRGIELREMLRSDNPDRAAVLRKVQELSDLRGQMMKQHVEALLAAKTVLTPEQQRKVRSFMRSPTGGAPWRGGFGMNPGRSGTPPAPGGAGPQPPRGAIEPPVN